MNDSNGWATVPRKDKKKGSKAASSVPVDPAATKHVDKFAARIQATCENIEPPYAAFVFLCSNDTEEDCMRLHLFGLPAPLLEQMKGIVPYRDQEMRFPEGTAPTALFLFNYQTRLMRGVAVAITGPSINIEPDAWKAAHAKGFPAQIPVHFVDQTQCHIPMSERFEAGPLDATLASRLMTRLGATDVTVPNVQLDIPTPENEAERNEQAQREEYEKQQRAQQDEWEKSFKMLYPEATAAEKKKTTQGSWAALAKAPEPTNDQYSNQSEGYPGLGSDGPPDLSGPSLSEAYRKSNRDRGPAAPTWGGNAWGKTAPGRSVSAPASPAPQAPGRSQHWPVQEEGGVAWTMQEEAELPGALPGHWRMQDKASSTGSESDSDEREAEQAIMGGPRDLVAELAARVREGEVQEREGICS